MYIRFSIPEWEFQSKITGFGAVVTVHRSGNAVIYRNVNHICRLPNGGFYLESLLHNQEVEVKNEDDLEIVGIVVEPAQRRFSDFRRTFDLANPVDYTLPVSSGEINARLDMLAERIGGTKIQTIPATAPDCQI